ncbi:RNF19B [Cordylochernes scorpioides]|uniref:RBR-type E3 ubiquitin transferase n=1 Tax=Cordylochernes scorpioides TaxID=51811 RepID=A0ABY6JXD3_9ARAC|nr:RNF19B [Cordylochernes scorpioides]
MGGSTKTVSGLSTTTSSTTTTEPVLECPVCALELALPCFPVLSTCPHRTCYDCLQRYLQVEISESRVNLTCPLCPELIHPNDIRMVLNDDNLLGKYERFMLRRVLVTEPDARWCPAPDCGYVVIASSCASCPKLRCERPGCGTYFCYHCKHEWHPNQTCDTARAQRYPHPANPRSASQDSFSQSKEAIYELFYCTSTRGSISAECAGDDIKPCPCCKVPIIKMDDGSCNHMTCQVCGTEFCWLCMKEISDLHYLSPSGCTFWGKKPWSRKKKIFWQLGMLVGAPVGIALIAGIAVPAIIIGIPVWVGRKVDQENVCAQLHAKYKSQGNKHKKNLVVTGGVMASVLVSPILAGITVGIGVPILLAYVYGVVPISLCRSGGCGVTTSASGVRIEFDEEEPGTTTAAAEATGSTHRLDGPPPSNLESEQVFKVVKVSGIVIAASGIRSKATKINVQCRSCCYVVFNLPIRPGLEGFALPRRCNGQSQTFTKVCLDHGAMINESYTLIP